MEFENAVGCFVSLGPSGLVDLGCTLYAASEVFDAQKHHILSPQPGQLWQKGGNLELDSSSATIPDPEFTSDWNTPQAMAAPMGGASPSTSPRLPSPPPFPEVQIGPQSPGLNAPGLSLAESEEATSYHHAAVRRIRPGTKAADMASGPPLLPLNELDSPFQLQEHLKALHYKHTRNPTDATTTIPITHETALAIATPPPNVDRSLWLYELCRFLVQKGNDVVVAFFREDPPCSATTCAEMRASEWQYLCAVHDPPKSCCAIDYSCHTLDWAAGVLTSQKQFPSRLTLGNDALGGSSGGVRQLTNIMRRVYRIFAHAWFQHRAVFWQVEGDGGLYVLFKTVCDVYSLIPEENYTIPREAEGLDVAPEPTRREHGGEEKKDEGEDDQTSISTGATTRRHKHTPSVGSVVTTIHEGDEDDNEPELPTRDQTALLEPMSRSTLHEAPLARISKEAEKVEPAPAVAEEKKEEAPVDVKKEMAEEQVTKEAEKDKPGENITETGVATSEPDAPSVKVEEVAREES